MGQTSDTLSVSQTVIKINLKVRVGGLRNVEEKIFLKILILTLDFILKSDLIILTDASLLTFPKWKVRR